MFVKSSRPTYKRRIKKAQEGIKFATYTPVEVNQTDYRDLTSIDNPFNEFNFATTYDKPTALVVPETTETKNEVETKSEPVVVNNPTPPVVVNKPTQNVSTSTTWRSPYKDKAKWTKDLSDAYRKVGITNDNAIRMLLAQDALESGWGKSAQGKYNFGNLTTGSSWKGNYVVGNDKNAKGEAIKQKFRAYESMDDYAKDKIQFLKRLYDFDENDDINKFVAKLTGSNKGKRRYAEASNYAKLLTGVYNGIPKGENGMIVKYQEPAQGIQRRDNTYVQLPIDRTPITRTDENGKPWNELSTMERARLNVRQGRNPITSKPVARGNLEITSPEFDILAGVRGLPLGKVGEMAEQGLAKSGNRWARNRVVGRAISNSEIKTPTQSMPNNVGWGPRQTIKGAIHDKDTMEPLKLYSPKRYDAINEGAPKAGVWFQGRLGVPRTAANHSVPGKAEKAAKARDLFAKRPVRVEGDLELNKPLVTVGDVPNRAQIQRAADTMGGDGVIFNDVYDNGYGRNQVVFSYRTDLKSGKMFKKETQPLEKNQFIDTGTSMNGDSDINKNMQNFVDYLLNPETQQRIASIDAELGTKYGEAINRFIKKHKSGDLTVLPRNKGDVGLDNDIIEFSRSVPSEEILTTKDFDRVAFEILRDDFAHVPGHEAKHGIETVQAALLRDMTPTEYHQYAKTGGPRLQALMKDNIVPEDEFVKRIMSEHPEYNEVRVRNRYKYLTIPSEFNSQLHPLIEFEQRAGKSGVPNFKSVDEINRLINNNPYVGTGEKNGLRNLRLLFNHMIKDKEEFMRRFNKYGFGVVPATTAINKYDNE